MKIQMDQTTDIFIIVKSGQDATPLAAELFTDEEINACLERLIEAGYYKI